MSLSPRFWLLKGALYIGVGVATPLLLPDHPFLAVIQTIGLIMVGIMNLHRAFTMSNK